MASKEDFDKTAAAPKVHKIRITLTSRNVKNLEKCESQVCRRESGSAAGFVKVVDPARADTSAIRL